MQLAPTKSEAALVASAIAELAAAVTRMSVGLELELKWLRESVDMLVRTAADRG